MIIVTREYIYKNPELFEINDIIQDARRESEQKYGGDFSEGIKIKFIANFLHKINNKTKKITTKKLNKSIIASHKSYEIIKINKLSIIIEGKINKNVKNIYMKCNNILLLWKKFFSKIANKKDYVNNYCNRPLNSFDRLCCEGCLYNNTRNNLDELPEYVIYWP